MGQYHVNVGIGLQPECEVVGIYDKDENRAKEISGKFGVRGYGNLDELIEASDAVVVAVPTFLHYEIAKMALQRGRHVLVEKPITETVEQAEELVSIAREKGLILQVGHVERFNGAVLELGKIVESPLLIESRRLAPFNPRIADVGVILDLMIHDLDIIINLVNSDVTAVAAQGSIVQSKHEDVAVANLKFANGCIASLTASRMTQSKIRTLTISQTNAYIILDFGTQDIDVHRQSSSDYLMTREELKYRQESFVEKIYVHKDNPLRLEQQHFLRCIRGEQTPIVEGRSDIQTLSLAHRILKQVHE
jgi:predicted dehydrogenase